MAKSGGSWLSRMERRLMYFFGPADVKAADSRRPEPEPPAAATGPVIPGEFERTDRPRG